MYPILLSNEYTKMNKICFLLSQTHILVGKSYSFNDMLKIVYSALLCAPSFQNLQHRMAFINVLVFSLDWNKQSFKGAKSRGWLILFQRNESKYPRGGDTSALKGGKISQQIPTTASPRHRNMKMRGVFKKIQSTGMMVIKSTGITVKECKFR